MNFDSTSLWQHEKALQRLAGNHALLKRVVEMFINQIDEKYLSLITALSNKEREEVRFISHAIKGVSGDVGAELLRHKASSIEILSASDNWDEIEVQVNGLAEVIDATKSEMVAAHA
ncbi:Hpt domain-containing protein [Alteromonas stellipolaris]|uniref:Histidine kinase n=1 Tax=Alteromonas stellipolaris TaxID=233316 RepID=A0ABN4LL17_9ALTE|nr:Hpt domain-containing protein [Alteromonas stellipolaris]ALM91024.1 sensor/response hybrid [Alteromonas stellipolaris LMG 21856]AMJ74048.1 histidine kinase [Alteromonas stellipolaris]|tara:strand:- start:232 stop:582 length:351 start_codon:yes stop_codon:yes gene_type:complete